MSKYIEKEIFPLASKKLKDIKTKKEIVKRIKGFFDKHSELLFQNAPYDKLYMKPEDRTFMYELLDVDPKEIKETIKKVTFIKSSFKALNDPWGYTMLTAIVYYHKKKDHEMVDMLNFYLALHYYATNLADLLQYIQKQTMEYTVNNLSGKHDLKRYGTVFEALRKKVETFYNTYKKNLESGDDKKLSDYLMNLNTRIRQWIKGIMTEYRHNKDSGKYFNTDVENLKDDDNYQETSNISMDILKVSLNLTKDIFTYPPNGKIVRTSAKMNNVSVSALNSTVNEIREKADDKDLRNIITHILVFFIIDQKNNIDEVGGKKFVAESIKLYNKSNTKNQTIIEIKTLLDKLLDIYSEKYQKTNREATKINWRRSFFFFLIFSIQYYRNN